MDGVQTIFNIADLGTKRLSKARRAFLMFLIGLVQFDPSVKDYVAFGEDEFSQYLQKKAVGKTMESVRQVMLSSLATGMEDLPIQISKPMVKAVIIMALQPLVSGARSDEVNYPLMVQHYNLVEALLEFPGFMFLYGLFFMIAGILIGCYLNKVIRKFKPIEFRALVRNWLGVKERTINPVDDWDLVNDEMRQYRVLTTVDDAESGEEYFREYPGGMARYVKLDARRRDV